jgi:putative spermidine/putrescine transport system permease protein
VGAGRLQKGIFGGTAALLLLFLYLPLAIIVLYAFNKSNINAWPFPGFSTRWFTKAFDDPDVRNAVWLSVRIALVATALALILGTSLAFAFARYRFRGREALNFAVILPIILPGTITGVALGRFFVFAGVDPSIWTIIVGHTTFTIVIVLNNVLARLRRVAPSLEEASRDLGASPFQTFRWVVFPTIRTSLIAGALLAFALSFDEIAVTFFLSGTQKTLPLLILGTLRETQSAPEVNAIATVILLISLPMIAAAAYLMRDEGGATRVVAGE